MLTSACVRFVLLGVLFASAAASAQSLAVSVMDVQGLPDSAVRKVHKATVEQLKGLVAIPVSDALDWKGPKRSCSDTEAGCQREKVKAAGAPAVVALWLSGSRDSAKATAVFWLDGERASPTRDLELALDAPDLKVLLDGVVPAWMKKGWGGVRLSEEPPPGSVLKVDGRVLTGKRAPVIALSSGAHQLDVVFPDGRAVLQRIDVAEGSRTRVEVAPPAGLSQPGAPAGGISALRVASYAAWMVGAATLLSAFIVAFVGRSTANGNSPCRPDSRGCVDIEVAQENQRKAAGYASIANVLLGTGLAFSVAGAGLFTIDAVR